MTNYLTAEFSKLIKRKNFFISLALVILASLGNIIVILFANPYYASMSHDELQAVMLRFGANKFVAILIVFITTVFLTGTNGNTIKNAITIGYSRSQIYFSKIILGVVVLFVLAISSMVATFGFCGIWLHEVFTVEALWEALVRYALLMLVYATIFIIAITLSFMLNSNTLFAIVYFILFLVFSEIISTVSSFSVTIATLHNMSLVHQLDQLIHVNGKFVMMPYIIGCSIAYSAIAMTIGAIVINRKDIK